MLVVRRPLALFTIMTLAPGLATAQDLVPLFSNGAGAVSQVASVQVAQNQFVTAVINSTGHLEVIGWYADFSIPISWYAREPCTPDRPPP